MNTLRESFMRALRTYLESAIANSRMEANMMKITITFDTGNAAFKDSLSAQVAELMRRAAAAVDNYTVGLEINGRAEPLTANLKDFNGNTVGSVEIVSGDRSEADRVDAIDKFLRITGDISRKG